MNLEEFKILYNKFSKLSLPKKIIESEEYENYLKALGENTDCSNWYLLQELRKRRFDHSNYCCLELAYHISCGVDKKGEIIMDDVDVILRKWDNGTIGIPIHDGGSSMITIRYCPFCGSKIPSDLNNN